MIAVFRAVAQSSVTTAISASRRQIRILATRMASMTTPQPTDEVVVEQRGHFALTTLNRPKALNALNTSMIIQLTDYFKEWDTEGSKIQAMVVQGAGGKAFCAGGDVKGVVLADSEEPRVDFFHREYSMNYLIAKLKKPMVCLMDGIVMGGGCGVAMHAPFRIATEKTLCAMPECAIGFMPDVGASYFLNRLPDTIGPFMGMTGKRIKGLELKAVGLATHYIASHDMPLVLQTLEEMGASIRDHSAIDAALKRLEVSPTAAEAPERRLKVVDHLKEMPPLYERLAKMGSIFNPYQSTLDEIIATLDASNEPDAKEALENLNGGAPLSVALTYELMKRMAGQSLKTCLETETLLATRMSQGKGEFFEGVRALLIDKDKSPKWKYPKSQITPELLDAFFQPEQGDFTLFGPHSKL